MRAIPILLVISACAQTGMITRPMVHEYVLDPKTLFLKGATPADDQPVTICALAPCYVYPDADMRVIKKYIQSLEASVNEKH